MENDLVGQICELIRLASTDLPAGVEKRLRQAESAEAAGSPAQRAMQTILDNVAMTRRNSTPICQDTGTPIFFVSYPPTASVLELTSQIRQAVEIATQESFLRPNAVDALTGNNTGTNLGDEHFPSIYFKPVGEEILTIDLILKGGGCENVGRQYSLPDEALGAGRDLEGVRRVVLDAVQKAQGEGCAPGFLGVAIGGDRGTSYAASKEVFLRDPDLPNPHPALNDLEERITREANELGIGPMGFGGKSTLLKTMITGLSRLPASYFVTVSYMCWAYRRRRMIVDRDGVRYE